MAEYEGCTEMEEGGLAKALEGKRKFYTLTLAVEDDGSIVGGGVFEGEILHADPPLSPAVRAKCYAVAMLLTRSAPELIGLGELVVALDSSDDDNDTSKETVSDNSNKTDSRNQSSIGTSGLKEWPGTNIH